MKLTAEIIEAIKNSNSREEIVKALFTDKDGDIDLCELNFPGIDVFLSELKAKNIYNDNQEAEEGIFNYSQEAEEINNNGQEAVKILNKVQTIK